MTLQGDLSLQSYLYKDQFEEIFLLIFVFGCYYVVSSPPRKSVCLSHAYAVI